MSATPSRMGLRWPKGAVGSMGARVREKQQA